ncbi:hypothetical protein ACLKA7_006425 [Drosophila subpalustris]
MPHDRGSNAGKTGNWQAGNWRRGKLATCNGLAGNSRWFGLWPWEWAASSGSSSSNSYNCTFEKGARRWFSVVARCIVLPSASGSSIVRDIPPSLQPQGTTATVAAAAAAAAASCKLQQSTAIGSDCPAFAKGQLPRHKVPTSMSAAVDVAGKWHTEKKKVKLK